VLGGHIGHLFEILHYRRWSGLYTSAWEPTIGVRSRGSSKYPAAPALMAEVVRYEACATGPSSARRPAPGTAWFGSSEPVLPPGRGRPRDRRSSPTRPPERPTATPRRPARSRSPWRTCLTTCPPPRPMRPFAGERGCVKPHQSSRRAGHRHQRRLGGAAQGQVGDACETSPSSRPRSATLPARAWTRHA
jgi:hypothetical protein